MIKSFLTSTGSGSPGPTGPAGTRGSLWSTGAGAPSSPFGNAGDQYLDTSTGDVYVSSGSAWVLVGNIKGATGANGSAGTAGTNGTNGSNGVRGSLWSAAAGVPGSPFGNSGDQYLNTSNGDVYTSTGSAWTLTGNIRGSTGTTGSTGSAGTNGTNGANGTRGSLWTAGAGAPSGPFGNANDQYLNTSNGDVYTSTGSSWTLTGNIKGATGSTGSAGATGSAGTNGTNGANGTRGSLWSSGSGAPGSPFGLSGDLYLNTANGDVYTSTGSAWSLSGNIKGTAGATGATGATGSTGAAGVNAISDATPISLVFGTAVQPSVPSKPAIVTVNITSTATISLTAGQTHSAELVIAPTQTAAQTKGTGHRILGTYTNSNTGSLTIGLNLGTTSRLQLTAPLPIGWWVCLLQTAGTVSIVSAFEQAVG